MDDQDSQANTNESQRMLNLGNLQKQIEISSNNFTQETSNLDSNLKSRPISGRSDHGQTRTKTEYQHASDICQFEENDVMQKTRNENQSQDSRLDNSKDT